MRPSQILPIDGDGRVDESTRPPLTATGRAHGLSNAPNAHTSSPTRDNNEHDAHTRAPDDTRGRGLGPRASPETDTSLEAARRDVIAWHATLDRPCPLQDGWCFHTPYMGAATAYNGRSFWYCADAEQIQMCPPCTPAAGNA